MSSSIIPSLILNKEKNNSIIERNTGQELELAFEKFADVEAVVSCNEGIRRTFSQLKIEVDRLAAGFISLGLKPGDIIAIWAPTSYLPYLTTLAAIRGGFPLLSLNPALQGPELFFCLNKVKAKAIITLKAFKYQNFYKILEETITVGKPNKVVPSLQFVIIDTEENLPGILRFESVLNLSTSADIQKFRSNISSVKAEGPCNIQFTSGTTGKPKGVVLSHQNLIYSAKSFGKIVQISHEDRICCQVPLFHVFGLTYGIFVGLLFGTTVIIPCPGFQPKTTLESIVKEKCTVIYGTPTMWVDMIKYQKQHNIPIETAKIGVTGGAACSPQLFEDILSLMKLRTIKTIYGLTETSGAVFISVEGESLQNTLKTVGRLIDNHGAKVTDFEGNIVPMGVPGELCIKGPTVMLGYFGEEERTKEALDDEGWFRTGDQFVLREDGYGIILGRIKDMLIRGGENIYPKEIEDFLNTHPEILEAHVVGVPDERLGEEVCAFIRAQEGSNLTVKGVKEFCKGNLSFHKIPKYINFVEELPKTPIGKIQKFKLKESFSRMCFQ